MGDISAIKVVERNIEIVDPGTGDRIGVRIGLRSLDDDTMKKTKDRIQKEANYLARRNKDFEPDQIEANANDVAFSAMSGWEWYDVTPEKDRGEDYKPDPATFKGEIPAFNRNTVHKVLSELFWMRNQIMAELNDDKAFFTTFKPI